MICPFPPPSPRPHTHIEGLEQTPEHFLTVQRRVPNMVSPALLSCCQGMLKAVPQICCWCQPSLKTGPERRGTSLWQEPGSELGSVSQGTTPLPLPTLHLHFSDSAQTPSPPPPHAFILCLNCPSHLCTDGRWIQFKWTLLPIVRVLCWLKPALITLVPVFISDTYKDTLMAAGPILSKSVPYSHLQRLYF